MVESVVEKMENIMIKFLVKILNLMKHIVSSIVFGN